MSRSSNKTIIWSLIILLAIISVVGEGLHFIPGCGHGIKVGDGVLLVGISIADHDPPTGWPAGVERPNDRDIPTWDEGDCPICSLLAQYYSSVNFKVAILVMPFVHDLAIAPSCVAFSSVPHFCLARAPPLA